MRHLIFTFCFFCYVVSPGNLHAKTRYGVYIPDKALYDLTVDSLNRQLQQHPLLINADYQINAIEKVRHFEPENTAFLIAIGLLLLLGIFKNSNSLYFRNLWVAFKSVAISNRQLKDQLSQNQRSALLLNSFFCITAALYIYLVLNYFYQGQDWMRDYNKLNVIIGLFLSLVVIYFLRYLFLRIAGWLFDIQDVADSYSFQIFLLNKVLGMLLLPFLFILAFGQGAWVQVSLLLSFLLIGAITIYRYTRSGALFRSFVKISKFHFFMYLCGSEILPLAILVKLFSIWLNLS